MQRYSAGARRFVFCHITQFLLYEDLLAIYSQLHIVDNNGPKSKGGGGAPRKPPAPPICA